MIMEATLLNEKFEAVSIIDTYKSFIWTDRFDEAGDFELHVQMEPGLVDIIKKGYYLWVEKSEHQMVVETIQVDSDTEDGAYYIVSGRSLESIIDRRIIWNQTKFSRETVNDGLPNLQDCVEQLLNENIINPTIAARKIDNFIFEKSTDEKVTSLTLEAQYYGDELYDVITKLCKENEIGFKVTLNDANQFVFKLYAGVDRSYEQSINPYVIFSPEYNNVLSTNYLESDQALKNVTLVAGEEIKSSSTTTGTDELVPRDTYVVGFATGIERREIFTDSSVTRNTDSEDELTEAQYQAHLKQAGIDTLIENTELEAFEAEIDYSKMYVYGEDYFIGDIVQIENEYGQEGRAYISEYIMSCEESGFCAYPTFKTIQKGVYDE